MLEIAVVVTLIAIICALAIPNMLAAQRRSQTQSCILNLKMIQRAKNSWAVMNKKSSGALPTTADLTGAGADNSLTTYPKCPGGGTYSINDVATVPTCTIANHAIPLQQ
jgi:type II secretory pathway pseudopilin PulG